MRIELTRTAPEAIALSTELRMQVVFYYNLSIFAMRFEKNDLKHFGKKQYELTTGIFFDTISKLKRRNIMQTSRGKTVLIILLSLIVVAAGIAGVVLSMKDKSEDKQIMSEQPAESVAINEDEVAKDKLLKDKYPEVNNLIQRYREGLTSGDVNILKEVYDSTESMSVDVVTSTSEIIESYSNTVCYTKRGLEDDSYFVFIYDHLKINGIDTPVPNLSLAYVKTNAEGQLYIYRGVKNTATGSYEYDSATQQYIQLLNEDEEVKNLMATVYQEKEAACSRDEALRDFIDGLTSPDSDVTDETFSETETDEDGNVITDETESNLDETETGLDETESSETEDAE